jgi:hypothetical protein
MVVNVHGRIAMRSYLRGIGLAAAAVVLQLVASVSAHAALNYTGQTATTVSVMYVSLPANTQIAFVDQISGATFAPSATVSGSGSLAISLAALPPGPGEYYLLAQEAGGWIAQTVRFYL